MSEHTSVEHTNEKISLRDEERSKCEVYTRVMGYYRPVECYNVGKKGEYNERTPFDEKTTIESIGALPHDGVQPPTPVDMEFCT